MTKTVKTFRDVKSAPARTQIYIKMLTRKHGATAKELEQAVRDAEEEGIIEQRRAEGYTSHNSYSLQKLADTYGFRFFPSTEYEGAKRYFFASVKNDPKLAKQAEKLKAAKQAAKAAKLPATPNETPEAAIIAKASRKPRNARA